MRKTCYEVLKELKLENNKLFELALELEHVALNADPSFQDVFVEELAFPPRSAGL